MIFMPLIIVVASRKPVRSEAEGLGDDESDLPIKGMPPGVACSEFDGSSHRRS